MQKLDVSMSPCLQKNSHLAFSARWERTSSGLICPCWGDEVLILVAWLAFGFGINRRTQQAQKSSLLEVCLARRRTTKFVVNHQVDAKGTASID